MDQFKDEWLLSFLVNRLQNDIDFKFETEFYFDPFMFSIKSSFNLDG